MFLIYLNLKNIKYRKFEKFERFIGSSRWWSGYHWQIGSGKVKKNYCHKTLPHTYMRPLSSLKYENDEKQAPVGWHTLPLNPYHSGSSFIYHFTFDVCPSLEKYWMTWLLQREKGLTKKQTNRWTHRPRFWLICEKARITTSFYKLRVMDIFPSRMLILSPWFVLSAIEKKIIWTK